MLNARGTESTAALTPVRLLGSVSFLYFKHNDVYILSVTRQNANAMLAMTFMKQVWIVDLAIGVETATARQLGSHQRGLLFADQQSLLP